MGGVTDVQSAARDLADDFFGGFDLPRGGVDDIDHRIDLRRAALAADVDSAKTESAAAPFRAVREVGDLTFHQQLRRGHLTRHRRLVAARRASARGEILLAHRGLAHVTLGDYNEPAGLLERVGQDRPEVVGEGPAGTPVTMILKLGYRDGVPQAALGRGGVSGAQGQAGEERDSGEDDELFHGSFLGWRLNERQRGAVN